MRVRRGFATYADIYGIIHDKLAGVDIAQTPPRRNYTILIASILNKRQIRTVSSFTTFLGSNYNLNTFVIWVDGKSEGYMKLEVDCNH